MMKLGPTNWRRNIVPRSSDGSCAPKECDGFGVVCMTCELCSVVCKQKMVFFAMARCNNGVHDENFLHHEV